MNLAQIQKLQEENIQLNKDINCINKNIQLIDIQFSNFKKSNTALKKDYTALKKDYTALKKDYTELKKDHSELKKDNTELKKSNFILKEKIKELEYNKSLNSSNSSKPPSSDGLKKQKRTQSLRTKSNLEVGGQFGHKGHTLLQTENPDEIIKLQIEKCSFCKTDLKNIPIKNFIKRQEFEIDPAQLKVTEYRCYKKKCPKCKQEITANFPEKIKGRVQYGPMIQALSAYLNNEQLIPLKRTSTHFKQNYKSSLCPSTVFNLNKKLNERLDCYLSEIKQYLEESEIKHLDETGFRMQGKTSWLHNLSNKNATYYRASQKRGDIPLNVKNTVIHDNYCSYNKLKEIEHGLCNIHHLRELKALKEIERENWARHFYTFLELLRKKKKHNFKEITKSYQTKVETLYDKLLETGLTYHESLEELPRGPTGRKRHRRGHNLLRRFEKNKDKVLLFLYKEKVPFSNNQAERDIRMMKLKQKISGCFRTLKGGEQFSRIKSVFSTLSKQGINILEGIEKIQNTKLELNLIPP